MPQTGFLFQGFLPAKPAARRQAIAALRELPWPLVFYEAPHRVVECVEDLAGALGGARDIVIARELTKVFEEIHRCRLDEAAAWLGADANHRKGEFVLVVGGAEKSGPKEHADAERVLQILMGELPLAQSVKLACAITGAKRNQVYPRALELAGKQKA
jgi:16S rRNA (cytidine1402-2'-O)-methyltransferase